MSSKFTYNSTPMIRHKRSQFDLSRRHLTTINMGDLVPIYWEEVIPGDTIKAHMKEVVRTTTPFVKPIMDNLFIDTYFFFVPNRLVMKDWAKVFGDSTGSSSWSVPDLKEVPSVGYGSGVGTASAVQTLADYFGIPVSSVSGANLKASGDISSLLFRGYALIYNEWFRDENNEDPVLIQLGDASNTPSGTENLNDQEFSVSNYTGLPAKINKVHDRFTSALPAPQKGQAISFNLIDFPESIYFPVRTRPQATYSQSDSNFVPMVSVFGDTMPASQGWYGASLGSSGFLFGDSLGSAIPSNVPLGSSFGNTQNGQLRSYSDVYSRSILDSEGSPVFVNDSASSPSPLSASGTRVVFAPANLWADVSGQISANLFDVNDLRFAFQAQKYLERDAYGGSRYIEFLRSHFGVIAGDARLQRTEYLGGKRTPIAIYQENQTSAPTEDSPLGQVAGWSLTQSDSGFNKSFVEHGYIIGLAAVRQFHTYQQGVHPSFYRHSRFDYYDPLFANIGEQPVYKRELYVGQGVTSDSIFGYQEAWSEYRQSTNRISGFMRSGISGSLDIWHLGDYYQSAPVLGQEFLEESNTNLDRVLSVESEIAPNFLFDTYVDVKAIRDMPTYSIPGLIDHH